MTEQEQPALILQELINALERNSEEDQPLLTFSRYHIARKKGRGGQAFVFEILDKLNHSFALKIYYPQEENNAGPTHEAGGREMQILAQMHHRNIPRMYAGGIAMWRKDERRWDVTETTPQGIPASSLTTASFYFYIMEFVGWEATEFVRLGQGELPMDGKTNDAARVAEIQSQKAVRFEELCTQSCEALALIHSHRILHGDIVEDNIRYSEADGAFKLVDFGFARTVEPRTGSRRSRSRHSSSQSPPLEDQFKIEIGCLADVLMPIFNDVRSTYDINRATGIERALKKAQSHDLSKVFVDAQHFRNALEPYFMLTHQSSGLSR